MGNITENINNNKYELSLTALAFTIASFAYYQNKRNSEVRSLANALDPDIPAISQQRVHIYPDIN
jgi:hypothetical protein